MKTRLTTWSPFQSPEVRDILEHLSPSEERVFMEHSSHVLEQAATSGLKSGFLFAIPSTLIGVSCFYSVALAIVLFVLFVAAVIAFSWWRGKIKLRKIREMLCETQYARERGYRPESLRLARFPWSHKEPSKKGQS
jgi:hypothetical protein